MPCATTRNRMQILPLMERFRRSFNLLTTGLLLISSSTAFSQLQKWGRFEQTFESSADYKNPVQEAALSAVFRSPSGENRKVLGFLGWRQKMEDPLCSGSGRHMDLHYELFGCKQQRAQRKNRPNQCGCPGKDTRFSMHGPSAWRPTADTWPTRMALLFFSWRHCLQRAVTIFQSGLGDLH